MSLLFLDTSVIGYEQIQAASKCRVILFNRAEDTYASLLNQVTGESYSTIGFVQHGPTFSILDKEVEGPKEFFRALKATTIDLISCRLYEDPAVVEEIKALEAELGINIRASRDDTGNLAAGGNWMQESDGVDIRDLYFTEAIEEWRGLLYATIIRRSSLLVRPIIDISNPNIGLTTPMVSATLPVDPRMFVSASQKRFSLPSAWGNPNYGVNNRPTNLCRAIQSTGDAFAIIKEDKSIQSWGSVASGGNRSLSGSYIALSSNNSAFAALKEDKSIQSWGSTQHGGDISGSSRIIPGSYTMIASNLFAFAALKEDKSIKTWGHDMYGGNNRDISGAYIAIAANGYAFAALKQDKSIFSWGAPTSIGSAQNTRDISGSYKSITASIEAFAALKEDKSIKVWGNVTYGGGDRDISGSYIAITSNNFAFAALKEDKSIISWGLSSAGGSVYPTMNTISGKFTCIASTLQAFAAIDTSGNITAWGDTLYGGGGRTILGNFVAIASNAQAFAALDSSGNITAWGNTLYGGDISGAIRTLSGPFTSIATNSYGFSAMKTGTTISWGYPGYASDASGNTRIVTGSFTDIVSNSMTFVAIKEYISSDTALATFTINGTSVLTTSTLDLSAGTTTLEIRIKPRDGLATLSDIAGFTRDVSAGTYIYSKSNLVAGTYTYAFPMVAEDGTTEHYIRTVHIFSNDNSCDLSANGLQSLTPTGRVELPANTSRIDFLPAPLASISGTASLTGLVPGTSYSPVFTVIAEDGTQQLYTPTIYILSDDTRVHVKVGETVYDVSNSYVELPDGTTSFSIMPRFNGASMTSVHATDKIAGYYPYQVTVTAEDRTVVATYTVTVRILPSTDTSLQSYLFYEFPTAHGATHYVPPGTRAVPITAAPTHPRAPHVILGHTRLQSGINLVIARVTAEDGVTIEDHVIRVVVRMRTALYEVSSHTSLIEARRGQQALAGYLDGQRIADYESYMRMKRYYR